MFQGWFRLDGGNKIPVVSGAVSDVSGKTVRVDAVFAEFSYVLFMSKDGSAVVHTAQGSSGNAVSNADLNTAAEMVNLSLAPRKPLWAGAAPRAVRPVRLPSPPVPSMFIL